MLEDRFLNLLCEVFKVTNGDVAILERVYRKLGDKTGNGFWGFIKPLLLDKLGEGLKGSYTNADIDNLITELRLLIKELEGKKK